MADVLVVVVLEVVVVVEAEVLVVVEALEAEVLLPAGGNISCNLVGTSRISRNLRRLRLSGTNTCAMKGRVRVEGFWFGLGLEAGAIV